MKTSLPLRRGVSPVRGVEAQQTYRVSGAQSERVLGMPGELWIKPEVNIGEVIIELKIRKDRRFWEYILDEQSFSPAGMSRDEIWHNTLPPEIATYLRHRHTVTNSEIEADRVGVAAKVLWYVGLIDELGHAGNGVLTRLSDEEHPVSRLRRQIVH